MKYFITRIADEQPLVVAVSAYSFKDYVREHHVRRFAKAPPTSIQSTIPANSWVFCTGMSARARAIAKKLKDVYKLQAPENARERLYWVKAIDRTAIATCIPEPRTRYRHPAPQCANWLRTQAFFVDHLSDIVEILLCGFPHGYVRAGDLCEALTQKQR